MINTQIPYISLRYLGCKFEKKASDISPMAELLPIAEDMLKNAPDDIDERIFSSLSKCGLLKKENDSYMVSNDMQILLDALFTPGECIRIITNDGEGKELCYYVLINDAYLKVIANKGIATLIGPQSIEQISFEIKSKLSYLSEASKNEMVISKKTSDTMRGTMIGYENNLFTCFGTDCNDSKKELAYFVSSFERTKENIELMTAVSLNQVSLPKKNYEIADYEKAELGLTKEMLLGKRKSIGIQSVETSKTIDEKKEESLSGIKVFKGVLIALAVNVCLMIVNALLQLFV